MIDPRSVDASTKKRQKMRRDSQRNMGFEWNPPRCLSCKYFRPAAHGVPLPGQRQKPYRHAACGLGHFDVEPHSICDRWRGRNGDTLILDEMSRTTGGEGRIRTDGTV
jgi:hypothetical protein